MSHHREPYPEEIVNAENEGYFAYWDDNTNPYNLCEHPSLHEAWGEGYKKAEREDSRFRTATLKQNKQ